MAIYHLSVKMVKRSTGRSSVGAAAYRAGEKIYNERDGMTHDYTHRSDVVHSEIITPENVPEWVKERAKLWNEVEKFENRGNSQTAREIEVALPRELTHDQQIELVREYVNENFIKEGMIADFSVHAGHLHEKSKEDYEDKYIDEDIKNKNPHAHILLTTRRIDFEKGTFEDHKAREWAGDPQHRYIIKNWRRDWADTANHHLERAGYEARIDHRSYKDQGIEKVPTIHEGPTVRAMESRGIETEIGDLNREAQAKNKELENINQQLNELEIMKRSEKMEVSKQENEHELPAKEYQAFEKGVDESRGDQETRDEKQYELTIDDKVKETAQNRKKDRADELPAEANIDYENAHNYCIEWRNQRQFLFDNYINKEKEIVQNREKDRADELPAGAYMDYEKKVNDSFGDQRTPDEKRQGITIDDEENARRSASKFHDAERDLDRAGIQQVRIAEVNSTITNRMRKIDREQIQLAKEAGEIMKQGPEQQKTLETIEQKRDLLTEERLELSEIKDTIEQVKNQERTVDIAGDAKNSGDLIKQRQQIQEQMLENNEVSIEQERDIEDIER